MLQSIRDQTGTSSWTKLANDVSGTAEQTRERRYWGILIIECLGLAYLAGEPVYLRPITIDWVNRRRAPMSVQERADLWTSLCTLPVDELVGTAFQRKYGYDDEGGESAN